MAGGDRTDDPALALELPAVKQLIPADDEFAWAIHTEAASKYPDRFEKLNETAKLVFSDPSFKEVYSKTAGDWRQVSYGDRAVCRAYADGMMELARRYRPLLSAKKKRPG